MLLTEKEVNFGKCTEEDDSAFQAKDCEASPTKKTFLSQFWADARGREKGKVKTIFSFCFGQDSLILYFCRQDG